MIFVNTSLDVALKRNEERTRTLPEDILKKSWKDVQKNLGGFQSLFGSTNFVIVDNSKFLKPAEAQKKFGRVAKKYVDILGGITKKAMKQTEESLNVGCPLDCDYKVGNTWAETH